MILLDKSEYDKVAEKLASEGFFRRFEEMVRSRAESKKSVSKDVSRPVGSSVQDSRKRNG